MMAWLLPLLAGGVTGVLSAFGIGGGSLLLIYLTSFAALDQHQAQGINLLYFLPAAAAALPSHAKNGLLEQRIILDVYKRQAARIQEQVPGIKGYNATYTNYTVPVDASGETLTLLDTESSESGLDSLLAGYGDFSSSVATYASTDTRFDSYFAGGYLELVAGRHLTEADTNGALLSLSLIHI